MSAATPAWLQLAARACLATVFLVSGVTKALDWPGGLAEVAGLGLPLPGLALAATVAVQLLGGLAVLTGLAARWGALALALFTLLATLAAHAFWAAPAAARGHELTTFLEHLGLIGGFLLLAAVGPGPLSLAVPGRRRAAA
ncbi:putative oxidoreductase [Tistlia consotensis]|uniref:Putative oxidoreductase n=1 Tax=Tistlia consotensis USBA 355 TaxID=560819 RepID=A0A1Y6BCA2_9PROT|nr:DoxX family membrane protein [Tistlia consotensis]SMF03720.1 putative oxidoreductase [Tistlia consotensis USBA 355]SNR53967.1 putative oxidoreductase [Tistlia consotensis]